jgi:3-oxoacyl-[acyl-carrier protein] reductase
MEISFDARTVLITGAARGIGRAIAHGFAGAGARVFATDLLFEELEALRETAAPQRGGSIETRVVDATDARAVEAVVAEAAGDGGAIDVLVHAAGGVRGQSKKPFEDVTEPEWDAIYDANVKTAFIACRAVVPGMKAARAGRIVVITSRAALTVSLTGIHAYGTAKTAQVGLIRQLASELGPFGITINGVAPGFMPTSPDYVRQWDAYGPEGQAALVGSIAMRRVGEPADIAHAVLFLASDYASWITGQVLPVTGGPL